jgi:hypothetical protein
MVLVESANGQDFPGTLELTIHDAVFPAGAGLLRPGRCNSTVGAGCESDVEFGWARETPMQRRFVDLPAVAT